jgi:hypothetical protein
MCIIVWYTPNNSVDTTATLSATKFIVPVEHKAENQTENSYTNSTKLVNTLNKYRCIKYFQTSEIKICWF